MPRFVVRFRKKILVFPEKEPATAEIGKSIKSETRPIGVPRFPDSPIRSMFQIYHFRPCHTITTLALLIFIAISPMSFAQEWVTMMDDPNANFYDIQNAFNRYWQGRTIEKGKGWKQFKRWEYFWEQRVYPTGRFPGADQASKAFLNYIDKTRKSPSTISTMADWQPLGPTTVTSLASNPGIGRINCVAIHPENPNIIYAGAPSGGFWRSSDGGQTWETTTDYLTALGVSSILIDPNNPNIIYIGSGDGDGTDTYSLGVLKSFDGGDTWQPTGLNWQTTQSRQISKLLMHPDDPQTLVAATSAGIYKTTDGGDHWTQSRAGIFKDIEFKPGEPSIVYAANRIFLVSVDGGESFSAISGGLPGVPAVSRFAIAVTPANPEIVYLLAGNNDNNGLLGVYRSTDSGSTFTLQADEPNLLGWAQDGTDSGGQSWYDLAIAVSPENSDIIFSGGVNIWKSTNGGLTWEINTHWVINSPQEYSHADIHSLDFYGTDLYAGTDGGVFFTEDFGDHWRDLSEGLQITQFYRLSGYAGNDSLIFAGAQDNGNNRYRDGGWSHVLGGDGMESIIDYSNSDIVYASWQRGGINKSTDGGDNFTFITSDITETGRWVTPFVMHPENPQTLYAGFSSLWKTTNGGDTWEAIFDFGKQQSALAISSANPNYIYSAGINAVHKSTDGGTTWENITTGLPAAVFTYIAISSDDPQKVWITLSGFFAGEKVYQSNDGGENWMNISGSLPNLPINCIVHQNAPYNPLYIGTDIGVYYRNDQLDDWQPFINRLPNVIISELEIHDAAGKIRAATYGRGLWESQLYPRLAFIDHTPNKDTEDLVGPYNVVTTILPGDIPIIADSVRLHYEFARDMTDNDPKFDFSVMMLPTGNPNEYSAQIPGQGSEASIKYFISTVDESGLRIQSPANVPAESYRFFAGADTLPPIVAHEPIPSPVVTTALPLAIDVMVTDNLAVDTVWIEYSLNNEVQEVLPLIRNGEHYTGFFPFVETGITTGDFVEYRIFAVDAAANMNQVISGPYDFQFTRIHSFTRNVFIPIVEDNPAGIEDVLTISGNSNFRISDIDVTFKATHPNVGDLIVKLLAPSKKEITLIDRPGFPDDSLGNRSGNPDIILDDAAPVSIEHIPAGDEQQITGVFQPHPDSLAAFNAEGYTGDWTITVIDAENLDGTSGQLDAWGLILTLDPVTSIDDSEHSQLPQAFTLYQNYPNPFNPTTIIRYDLKGSVDVKLTIYNILGQEIRSLINERQTAGTKSAKWDALDNFGKQAASGIYIYKLEAGDFTRARKMVLLR